MNTICTTYLYNNNNNNKKEIRKNVEDLRTRETAKILFQIISQRLGNDVVHGFSGTQQCVKGGVNAIRKPR